MKVYIVIEILKQTGKFHILELFDNYESAISFADDWRHYIDKNGPYQIDVKEREVKK